MAKFEKRNRLEGQEKEELLLAFCYALHALKSPEEAAMFIRDLVSEQEAEMLAKRLKIAALLIEGKNFDQIQRKLKTSRGTIARVSIWLQESGEGFRKVVERLPEYQEKMERPEKWEQLKYKYPQYHWPQLLLEELFVEAPLRKQKKIMNILKKMPKKSALYKRLDKLIKES